jgi:cyanophycinase
MRPSRDVRFLLSLLVLGLVAVGESGAQAVKGSLFIIGGGDRSPAMMREFVALAGGPEKASIVVIPNASGEPDTACSDMAAEFQSLGVRHVTCLFLSRDQAMDPASAARLDGATAVYFTGGDQSRVTKALVGTHVQRKLKELYAEGAIMGGTSAGAALMSEVMITGDERLNKDTVNNFRSITKGNVVTVEGMGFVTTMIVDQHFVKRKRHNRLISVVLEHPALVGVGIDEATAIVVRPDGTFDVIGEGSVVVYDATEAAGIHADQNGNLSGGNIHMHLLIAGDSFDVARRTARRGGDHQ